MIEQYFQEDDPIINLENRLLEIDAKLKYFRLPGTDVETYTLGMTGVGKSTLIACLTQDLIEWKKNRGQYCGNAPKNCPKIGNNIGRSQTTSPQEYNVAQIGRMKDNPGLQDTRGPEQDIINSYLIANQFKEGKSIKLVIMLQSNDFVGQRGTNIVKLLNIVAGIFRKESYLELARSCLIVVSKIPIDSFTENQISGIISQIYQKHSEASLSRRFVEQILRNNGVAIFPQPENSQIMSINPQSINNIRQRITYLPPYLLKKQASIQLAPKSKNFLSKLASKTSSDLQTNTKFLANTIKNNIENKLDLRNIQSMKDGLRHINNTKAIIAHTFQKPTLENIESNLFQLKLPELVIKSTIKQLHKLDICQQLNALHITKKKKNEFIDRLMKPIVASQLQLKRKIDDYEMGIRKTNAMEKMMIDDRQSYMEMQNGLMMNMVNRMEENQNQRRRLMSEFNNDLMNSYKQHTENQVQYTQNLTQTFSQCKWKNYKVEITEEGICSIM